MPPSACTASAENEHDCLTSSSSSSSIIRVHCPELVHEGQWHHLAIIFHRASMLKNSSLSVVVDDVLVATHKVGWLPGHLTKYIKSYCYYYYYYYYCSFLFQLHYLAPYVIPSASSFPMSVYAYVGTPSHLKKTSHLMWRQGPCYLIEDVLNLPTVQFIYRLGPNYVGSFQAPSLG